MTDHPILFNSEMIKAVLDGRKTMTRRVITVPWAKGKRVAPYEPYYVETDGELSYMDEYGDYHPMIEKCPYGKAGDKLFVKETFQILNKPIGRMYHGFYKADREVFDVELTEREHCLWCDRKKPYMMTSGRFMYKSLARITLEITAIRVERVQDISIEDIRAEGLEITNYHGKERVHACYYSRWQTLWDSINKKRGYGWDKNPWVWVVEFEVVT